MRLNDEEGVERRTLLHRIQCQVIVMDGIGEKRRGISINVASLWHAVIKSPRTLQLPTTDLALP